MGSRRIYKYMRPLLIATPFLVPWLMVLVEEICGKGMGWNYVLISSFLLSLIVLYILGCTSAMRLKRRAEVVRGLIIFHIVKLPLFVVAWVAYMIAFLLICLSVNRLEGVQ